MLPSSNLLTPLGFLPLSLTLCYYRIIFSQKTVDVHIQVISRHCCLDTQQAGSILHFKSYTYIYIHIYIYTYIYIYIYIHLHSFTYIYIHLHTFTYIYIHLHTFTYIYIHLHTHTYTYIHIHTHTYTYIHIHTHTYTYIHIHTHTYTYIHIHTYIHTYIYLFIYMCTLCFWVVDLRHCRAPFIFVLQKDVPTGLSSHPPLATSSSWAKTFGLGGPLSQATWLLLSCLHWL